MTALPRPPFPSPTPPEWTTAYTRCLELEATESSAVKSRVLGYLLLQAPQVGRDTLSREINSCKDQKTLYNLGMFYIHHFIRAFKAGCRGPPQSLHFSPPSFDNEKTFLADLMQQPPGHSASKWKALVRDNHRCALSGVIDMESFNSFASVREGVSQDCDRLRTEAVRIFPQSINKGVVGEGEGDNEHMYTFSAGFLAVLQRFGLESLMDELNGDKIRRLENIITLRPDLHSLFDTLDLWLEEDQSVANRYKICFSTGMRLGLPAFVTFTTPDPEHLPLPSPDLLLLHAVCARVAHLSGAGEYVDEILKDLEETRVLSPTGESAELLFHALAPLGIPVR